MHRDMKPANVLLASKDPNNINVKITDFGFSTFFDLKEGKREQCGSPLYMAPELLSKKKYNYKVDIWAVGIMLFKLLVGNDNKKQPYKNIRRVEDLENIAEMLIRKQNK